jgi:hypothetical protein
MISLFLLGLAAAATTDVPVPASPFYLACMQSGGTAGSVEVKGGVNNLRIYNGGPARIALMFATADGVNAININRTPAPTGETTSLVLRPGQGVIFNASQVLIENLGGTQGKSVDYCLRVS